MVRPNTLTGTKAIISHSQQGYYLRLRSGHIDFLETFTADTVNANTTLTVNAWNHVGVTISSAANATITAYLNGASDGSTISANTYNTHSLNLLIGADNSNNSQLVDWWDGDIAWVRVWNRFLSPQDIAQLYTEPFHIYERKRLIR